MNRGVAKQAMIGSVLVLLFLIGAFPVGAAIPGVTGTQFNLVAREGYVSNPDGGSIYSWGYALNNGVMQYPGPTLIVNQGDTITVTLKNELPQPAGNVSIVFPGHAATATGGSAGILTREAPPDGVSTVTYRFTAANPGTYSYHSGTQVSLQVDMGLVGAIIVRPAGFDEMNPRAYSHDASRYDYEHLFLLTEMDPNIHQAVASGIAAGAISVDTTAFFPVYWFINGRSAPDTMLDAGVPWLPNQPYNCMPMMHPGDRLLLRLIGAGRDLHPFHHHGNNSLIIARDGKLLQSASGNGPDLAYSDFTVTVFPGGTADAMFTWTGEKLGWDIYGTGPEYEHSCNGISVNAADPASAGFDPVTKEYCPDHGKPFPVVLPGDQELTFGGQWSGSPFMGDAGVLPPGEGGLNPHAGYFFMWHSHNEKEMTNYDVFPGGMMTMPVVLPPGAPIMDGGH
jgi:FtsP/CotA-like multicopper oxidase with cupredoxin domain